MYFTRLMHILLVATRQLSRVAWRRLRHRPLRGPEALREGIEEAGGCFVKFGQILALQIESLPREYCDALLSLLDRVPAIDPNLIDGLFVEEFGLLPADLFRSFNYTPVASASIGQVHRAELREGGGVAVKVQRPDARAQFRRDLRLLRDLMRIVQFLGLRRLYFMRDVVDELDSWTRDELDYRREAAHAALLARNAEGSLTERIPRIYWELSSPRVLTMEYLEGPSVSAYLRMLANNDREAIEQLRAQGFEPEIFSGNIISNFLRDAFHNGVFHADLHPANLLILPDNMVGYVDFGIVAKLTREARRKQIELTLAYSGGDPDAIYREFLNICLVGPDTDLEGMRATILGMAPGWYEEPVINGRVRFRVSVTHAMMDLLNVSRDHGAYIDREMIKYVRSTVLVDGLLARMAPSFDIARSLREVVEDYMVEQSRHRIFSHGAMLSYLTDLVVWVKAGPTAMVRALDLIERRQLRVQTNISFPRGKEHKLRSQVAAGFAVWAASISFLAVTGGGPLFRRSPFLATIAAVFMTLWTCWMVLLVRRLILHEDGELERT